MCWLCLVCRLLLRVNKDHHQKKPLFSRAVSRILSLMADRMTSALLSSADFSSLEGSGGRTDSAPAGLDSAPRGEFDIRCLQ